ncbi:MAG: Mur ligase family protein [Eubacteriales bacterium]
MTVENMTYEEMEAYLFAIPRFTKKHTQREMNETLVSLGVREESFRIIHIAGTNGKGSVCAYLQGILLQAGISVGMFTSPHLIHMRERFLVNGEMVAREKVLAAFYHVMEVVEEASPPSFFEMMFYLAMVLYQEEKVAVIILETGLGGRLDVTNCIKTPLLTAITRIGLDHTEYLGNTIEEVTLEKAGIIKEGIPVVYLDANQSSSTIIRQIATRKMAPHIAVSCENEQNYRFHHKKIDFSYVSSYYNISTVSISSIALYQVENVAIVLGIVDQIGEELQITNEAILKGIEATKWEGRMEEIVESIYLDGAHNVDGIRAFLQTVGAMNEVDSVLVFACACDKNYEDMIQEIAISELFGQVIITKVHSDRGADGTILETTFRRYGVSQVENVPDYEQLWLQCKNLQEQGKTIFIAGSLYLVGIFKALSKQR